MSQAFIVSDEKRGSAEEHTAQGRPMISAIPLQDMGIAQFTHRDVLRDEAFLAASSFGEKWNAIRDDLESWEPAIVPYLVARGITPDASVYAYWKELRIGDVPSTAAARDSMPGELREKAVAMEGSPTASVSLNIFVLAALSELLVAEEEVKVTGSAVAHSAFGSTSSDFRRTTTDGTHKILKIILDELLVDGLVLPVPESLAELNKFQTNADIGAFRSTFQPWVKSLADGTFKDEPRLRAEIKAAARAFRNHPRARRFSKLLTYISIPAVLVPEISGLVLGLTLTLAGLGLDKLAERWQKQGRWLSLCEPTRT